MKHLSFLHLSRGLGGVEVQNGLRVIELYHNSERSGTVPRTANTYTSNKARSS